MSSKKKLSLEDIFSDDEFGLLDSKEKASNVKTADQRLLDSFEEINAFVDKHGREPKSSSMSEYSLLARLKNLREHQANKAALKPFDRHNLLGEVEPPKSSIDDIFNDDDLGLLASDSDLSIFKYKHLRKASEREKTDFIAQRRPIKEADFKPYETMFQRVHQEIKRGQRRILEFSYESLTEKSFYINGGILLYLEHVEWDKVIQKFNSGVHNRPDGRTRTIFENGTISNMRFQSLYKMLHADGKMVTSLDEEVNDELFVNAGLVMEEDIKTGWVYVLKSRSAHPDISSMKNLYKIGFATTSIDERIKNAKHEATYLFADVVKVASYACYNSNALKLEKLLHSFFAEACLNVDLEFTNGKRISPREWFVVPFEEIERAIELMFNGQIVNYRYDKEKETIVLK